MRNSKCENEKVVLTGIVGKDKLFVASIFDKRKKLN
jgi:hypothetical protein